MTSNKFKKITQWWHQNRRFQNDGTRNSLKSLTCFQLVSALRKLILAWVVVIMIIVIIIIIIIIIIVMVIANNNSDNNS